MHIARPAVALCWIATLWVKGALRTRPADVCTIREVAPLSIGALLISNAPITGFSVIADTTFAGDGRFGRDTALITRVAMLGVAAEFPIIAISMKLANAVALRAAISTAGIARPALLVTTGVISHRTEMPQRTMGRCLARTVKAMWASNAVRCVRRIALEAREAN